MPPSTLPVETLSHIFELLFRARDYLSLSRCASASSTFYAETKRWLYRDVIGGSPYRWNSQSRLRFSVLARDAVAASFVKTLSIVLVSKAPGYVQLVSQALPNMRNLETLQLIAPRNYKLWPIRINSVKLSRLVLHCGWTPELESWFKTLTTLREVDFLGVANLGTHILTSLPPGVKVVHGCASPEFAVLIKGSRISHLTLQISHKIVDPTAERIAVTCVTRVLGSSGVRLRFLRLVVAPYDMESLPEILLDFLHHTPSIETLHLSFQGSLACLSPEIGEICNSFRGLRTLILDDNMRYYHNENSAIDWEDKTRGGWKSYEEGTSREAASLFDRCTQVTCVHLTVYGRRGAPDSRECWRRGSHNVPSPL